MTDHKTRKEEIKWKTISTYIDVDTGEIIEKEIAQEQYTIIHKNKKHNVHRKTGITTITYECRKNKYKQRNIFETTDTNRGNATITNTQQK